MTTSNKVSDRNPRAPRGLRRRHTICVVTSTQRCASIAAVAAPSIWRAAAVTRAIRLLPRTARGAALPKAGQVPPPRFHMVRYHGVLAAAKWRSQIVPRPQHADADRDTCQLAPGLETIRGRPLVYAPAPGSPGERESAVRGFLVGPRVDAHRRPAGVRKVRTELDQQIDGLWKLQRLFHPAVGHIRDGVALTGLCRLS